MKKGFSLKSIIIAGVSIFTIVGAFLPWVTVKFLGLSESVNGMSGEKGIGDGIFFIIGGIAVIALALAAIKKDDMNIGFKIAISAISGILAVIAIAKIADASGIPMASAGIGLYVLAVSDLIAAALPWVPLKKKI